MKQMHCLFLLNQWKGQLNSSSGCTFNRKGETNRVFTSESASLNCYPFLLFAALFESSLKIAST